MAQGGWELGRSESIFLFFKKKTKLPNSQTPCESLRRIPMSDVGLLETVARLLESGGIDLSAWALAWARVAPVIAIVPAFGLRALSAPVRAAAALLLAAVIIPAVRPLANGPLPFPVLLITEMARGTIVAVAAAVPLWAATMAGGVADALRGSEDTSTMPTVEDRASPLGTLFSLIACILFLGLGGPARVVGLLATPIQLEGGRPVQLPTLPRGSASAWPSPRPSLRHPSCSRLPVRSSPAPHRRPTCTSFLRQSARLRCSPWRRSCSNGSRPSWHCSSTARLRSARRLPRGSTARKQVRSHKSWRRRRRKGYSSPPFHVASLQRGLPHLALGAPHARRGPRAIRAARSHRLPVAAELLLRAGGGGHRAQPQPLPDVQESAHEQLSSATWISVFYGYPTFAWIPTHNLNHHKS